MSDGFIVHSLAPKKKETHADIRLRVLKVLVILLSVVLGAEALLYFAVMPCFSPARVSFSGVSDVTAEQLYYRLSPLAGQSWIRFDTVRATSLLMSSAAIADISAEKKFPDQILFSVTERTPVAMSLATVRGKTVPVQIDRSGVVFAVNKGIPEKSVPLVSGLSFSEPEEGMRLLQRDRKLMEQIEIIEKNCPEYFSVISEIKILPKNYGNYELILYPTHSHIKIYTDKTLNEESLKYMMIVIDAINSMDLHVTEVDLRYGSVSYKTQPQ
ncbi:MAG: FtsQ-type POTRA domain-containing protein [Bacteroides sp.]|nr:FtsQ-type POTRA domain-containing protein [Prevotella sp.]MCM1407440.1 FtsQ-type POTRA domain-containing protein [Treponema brennaborense]MCM1469930.1 FtsQ-type POTRA domain-containing protein [Bacteroides sp.]